MLPGKAEKRIASSVYITLVPPRREPAGTWQTQPQGRPAPREAPRSPGGRRARTLPEGDVPVPGTAAAPGGGFASVGPRPPPVLLLREAPRALCAETPVLRPPSAAAPGTPQALSTLAEAGPPLQRDVNGLAERDFSCDVCAFCHKGIGCAEAAVEAMGKQYHAGCFTCRTCQRPLAAQRYYQRDGRPSCDACYKATLEKCAKCRAPIAEQVVRALGKGYHPGCFACAACGRALRDESFAAGEGDEPYCVDDFYRTYAAVCGACGQPIVPHEGRDTYKIECLGRCFHESCYRCERCRIPLSPEPTENGCYPLGDRLLCKSCHVAQRDESSC